MANTGGDTQPQKRLHNRGLPAAVSEVTQVAPAVPLAAGAGAAGLVVGRVAAVAAADPAAGCGCNRE